MAYTFAASKAGYAAMYREARITDAKRSEVAKYTAKILAHRSQFEDAAQQLGKPHIWPAIAVVLYRESTLDFTTHLHNGDPLSDYTRHVPAGRPKVGHGPPFTFAESAQDALRLHGWDTGPWDSIEFWLYKLEEFNGWGYVNRNVNSPYLWRGTTKEQRGKYVSDGVFDGSKWDAQLGCVALLREFLKSSPPPNLIATCRRRFLFQSQPGNYLKR